jgi:hypothetical protein
MKSWIESCRRVYRPSASVRLPHTSAAPVSFCGELVQLIAAMILEIRQQGAIR